METFIISESPLTVKRNGKNWKDELRVPDGCVYPECYDFLINLPGVGKINIRPIRTSDEDLFQSFFKALSPRSVYLRFFTFLKQLPPRMLEQFTQIDYQREIALVALLKNGDSEVMVGDGRVIETVPGHSAEFSILISDNLQGKGIGACLLRHCFDIARQRGFKVIHGVVLAENRQMLALGRKMNFTIKHVAGTTEYELTKILE